MKHVLITGGAGFIGSHLCEVFLSRGYAVTAVDNLSTGRKSNLDSAAQKHADQFQFVQADVCQPLGEERMPLLQKHGLQGVLHFACPASPVDFDKIPIEILKVDSLGTMATVDLALKHRARYVLASTSEVYGDPLEHPQKEEYWGNVNSIGPRACYDETKRFAEAYVSTAVHKLGLNGGMVRIFNTYGPRMRPDDGRVVPEFCIQALKNLPVTVHGDGAQTRSFCFVSDLVEGIYRYYESSLKDPTNIGNPEERPIVDFAKLVIELCQSKSKINPTPARQDDPRRRCPDISKAKKHLGWTPSIGVRDGLTRTLEYFRAYV